MFIKLQKLWRNIILKFSYIPISNIEIAMLILPCRTVLLMWVNKFRISDNLLEFELIKCKLRNDLFTSHIQIKVLLKTTLLLT